MKQDDKHKAGPPVETRRMRVLATRRRILEAAYALFCDTGYATTTMEAIAERAGVAVQTLYFTFRTKPAILTEVLHAAVVGFEQWSPDLDAAVGTDHLSAARESFPWFRPFEAEPSPRRAIEIYADNTVDILARVGPLLAAIGGLGVPEVTASLARSESLREEAAGLILAALDAKGAGLRKGLSRRRGVDVFLVLTSAEVYHQLTARRGWSPRQVKQWLVDTLEAQLLEQPTPP